MQTENQEAVECIDITKRTHWIVKSVTPLSRVFMIDVQSRGMFKVQINLVLHFVNASMNPGEPPKIKQYLLSNSIASHQQELAFMEKLESASMECSRYYRKMKQVKQSKK